MGAQSCVATDGIHMHQALYDLAEILICDPVAAHRATTRSALYSLGCRHIEMVSNLDDFLEALENRPPDLAICEAQLGLDELCDVIHKLRRGQGYNPFLIIIVTAWAISSAKVVDIIDSGADGFLLRPFSAGTLDLRVRTHILNQKPFVVTEGYVGPERRQSGTRADTAFSIVPPNLLKMKIEARPHVDEAIRQFNVELRAARAKLAGQLDRLK
jgi:DNA-binding response OmpR family regulator